MINLDQYTENYNIKFYLEHLGRWPDICIVEENAWGNIVGYHLGKVEGEVDQWHGHVTAISVSPFYRRMGLGEKLMKYARDISELNGGNFVDLYVRVSNRAGIGMYESLGYIVYRHIIGYYAEGEDAYDMRLALSRDRDKKSVIPLKHSVKAEDVVT
eukprot:MONOS_6780.1-p1 / transcript=MONOS_6780.1 / gene=MONOS_6780 / organism=Monocercomonoides_exilis_PA203 / gene_product=Nat5 protein / transcript_product=Nat5 protein / location=Mono_scaffold00220:28186-28894(-) / protein_length=156 / sequence_SO=supercontig / SO=protein_coding / is_pseudo=false